jgi:hypothetical protein
MIKRILKRKTELIEHLFMYNTLMKNIFKGKILGERPRGRPRTSYIQDLEHLVEVATYSKLKNMANDRDLWQQGKAFR